MIKFNYTCKVPLKNEKEVMTVKLWNKLYNLMREILTRIGSYNVKQKICIGIAFLLIPALLLILPAAAVQKAIENRRIEHQVANSPEEVQKSGESGSEARDIIAEVSRGAQIDRSTVYLLARLIEGEAADEPYEGKVAVGAVVVNRTKDSHFPNSIPGVIYERDAFQSVSNGQINRPLSGESLNAAVEALSGRDPTGGALYFWNPATATSTWVWSRPVMTRIGGHVFAM